MYCNNCGEEVADNVKFCNICGNRIEILSSPKNNSSDRLCCICGSADLGEDCGILFVDKNNKLKEVCSSCEHRVELLEDGDPATVKYFKTIINSIDNDEVKSYINILLDDVSPPESDKPSATNSFQQNNTTYVKIDNSIWIKGLKVFVWIVFFALLIGGVALASMTGEAFDGFMVFLAMAIIAFLTVAGMMVFLDIADDIRAIRERLTK